MNKLYYVNHIHQYYQDPDEPGKKYFDKKPIGFFSLKEEAVELIKLYKKLPGFKDTPEGFYIDEYTIDSVYNEQINRLIQKDTQPSIPQENLYSICYQWENDDDDEIETLAFFSTKEKAQKALKELLKIPMVKLIEDLLDIYEENFNRKEWSEGFTTWAESLRGIPRDK